MDIGHVRNAVVNNELARRAGWNGKNMHIYAEEGRHLALAFGAGREAARTYKPVLVLVNARGEHQPGWVCSQEDFFADDWDVTVGGEWPTPTR